MSITRRVLALLRPGKRAGDQPLIRPDDPDLRVVVRSFDDTEAASAVLDRSELWRAEFPALLRHHLVLPDAVVDDARRLLEPDGWSLRPADQAAELGEQSATVIAYRIQRLDALHCSQESSRMAGLAQRLHGRALGWDALQPVGDERS